MPHFDRRKSIRQAPALRTHITVIDGNELLAARIVNISKDGVAAVYEGQRSVRSGNPVHADIVADGSAGLIATGLCCRKVYDQPTLSEGRSYSGISARQCGLEFVSPSDHQRARIGRLLSRLTPSQES